MLGKVFKWLGIGFLGVVVLFIGILAYTGYMRSGYDETAVPYIKEVVPVISEWDTEKARQYFIPSAFDDFSDEDVEKLFRWFSKLGKLESMGEPEFTQVYSGTTVQEGASTYVTYTVLARYENGDALLTIQLIDLGDSFAVYQFNVNSNALLD